MREVLAERLLGYVMQWSPEDDAKERPRLQAMAAYKYDGYQQFSPGMRYVESLASWLNQFAESDRRVLFDFIQSRLVFISDSEMRHLVSISFPDLIRPKLIHLAAVSSGIPELYVSKIMASVEYRVELRRSLFLGLSDGAKMDHFRRCNPDIRHEQVFQTYDIPETKLDDIQMRLERDIRSILGRNLTSAEGRFHSLFLMDDFSGSGTSYWRSVADGEDVDGKVARVIKLIDDEKGILHSLLDLPSVNVCIVLYVATEQALERIRRNLSSWLLDRKRNLEFSVHAVQTISDNVRIDPIRDKRIVDILERYFDDGILDDSYRLGRVEKPYLGFDQCGLPLVLFHNTPNNSIPLLWFDDNKKWRGLFPRVSRHRRRL